MTKPVVYCHGLPGGPGEMALAGHAPNGWTAADLLVCDSADPIGDLLTRFDGFASGHDQVAIHGFSLGAMAALHVAAGRPNRVSAVHLVAPAAPLTLGRFLPDMAGAQVFRVAQSAWRLNFLLGMQAAAVRILPGLVVQAMVSTATPEERALVNGAGAGPIVQAGLRRALIGSRASYAAWLRHYVSDWSGILAAVRCPVVITQGASDVWVPPAMTQALCNALPDARMTVLSGLGHYGALAAHLEAA